MHLKYTWWVVKQCSGVGSKLKVGGGGLDIRNHAKQKIKRIMAMVMFKFAKMWGEGV